MIVKLTLDCLLPFRGWYNRPVRVADIAELSGMNAMDSNRLILLALGAALTVAGGIMLSSAM